MTNRELEKQTQILAAIDEARLADLEEWARIDDWLRDNLTPDERRFFTDEIQRRVDRLKELLSLPDTTGAGR